MHMAYTAFAVTSLKCVENKRSLNKEHPVSHANFISRNNSGLAGFLRSLNGMSWKSLYPC